MEMAVFLAILLVGFAYVWVKGDLDWDKPRPEIPTVKINPMTVATGTAVGEPVA